MLLVLYDISGKKLIGSLKIDDEVLAYFPAEDIAIVPDLARHEEDGELKWSVERWRLVQRTQVETRPMEELMAPFKSNSKEIPHGS